MSFYLDVVTINERKVTYLKMRLTTGEFVTLGWVDNFGNLHVKK